MHRIAAVVAGLLGVLIVPLAASAATSWLAVLAHLGLSLTTGLLAWGDGLAGRPGPARAWGAWQALATAGMVAALQASSWSRGGWGWAPPFLLVMIWAWLPMVGAWVAAGVGEQRRRRLASLAVARRHAALGRVAAER